MSRKPKFAPAGRTAKPATFPPVGLDPEEQRATLEKLIAEQGVKPVQDLDQFLEEIGDAWPEEESVDEFIAAIRAQRREGTGRGKR